MGKRTEGKMDKSENVGCAELKRKVEHRQKHEQKKKINIIIVKE